MIWKKSSLIPKLKSKSEKFVERENDVLDVVLYGSFVRGGESRDVDFALLVKEDVETGKKLTLAQEFKDSVKEEIEKNIDVKSVSIIDLTDPTFMARTGIIAEGYSLLKENFLSELFGLKPYIAFTYSLKNLSQSEKTIFSYTLKGRRGEKGVLEELGGKNPARGLILIPIEHSEEFKEILSKHKVNYEDKISLWEF